MASVCLNKEGMLKKPTQAFEKQDKDPAVVWCIFSQGVQGKGCFWPIVKVSSGIPTTCGDADKMNNAPQIWPTNSACD